MKIVCALSLALHPRSKQLMPSPNDIQACALALQMTNAANISYFHVGPDSAALRDYFGFGIHAISHCTADDAVVAAAIAAYVSKQGANMLVTGYRGMQHLGTGMLPYTVAQQLQWPMIAAALEITAGNVLQYLPSGSRRVVSLPQHAVLSVHNASPLALHFAAGKVGVSENKIHKFTYTGTADQLDKLVWNTLDTKFVRRRLTIQSSKKGHERMLQAVGVTSKKGEIIRDGSALEKAQIILDILAKKRLR